MHDRTAMLADFIARRLLNTRPPQRADVYPIVASARLILLLIAQFRLSARAESLVRKCTRGAPGIRVAVATNVMITAFGRATGAVFGRPPFGGKWVPSQHHVSGSRCWLGARATLPKWSADAGTVTIREMAARRKHLLFTARVGHRLRALQWDGRPPDKR
jgi:hypothetical protein